MTIPFPEEFSMVDDFPPPDDETWWTLAADALSAATRPRMLVADGDERLELKPLYTARDQPAGVDPPGVPPLVRDARPLGAVLTGWDLCQEQNHPDLLVANRAILDDLEHGASSLLVQLDQSARSGTDPELIAGGPPIVLDGVLVHSVPDFDQLLAGVDLQSVGVALEAGAAFLPAAACLAALWTRRGIDPQQARGAFNADPLGTLARAGGLPVAPATALAWLSNLAISTARHYSSVTAVAVSTAPYHEAGATTAQELACGIATGVEYLRAMTGAGLEVDAAARQMLFRVPLGTHHFLAIAKLRALRKLWSRVVTASGGSIEAGGPLIHARTSNRVLTRRDPHLDMLRNTAAVFAAGVGGAQRITSVAVDAKTGVPDPRSCRVARNTGLVLQDEAHLHRVIDPAGGSWFLDQLTQQLAEIAWSEFQQIERDGGMLAAILNGSLAGRIECARARRSQEIARGTSSVNGGNPSPNLDVVPEMPAIADAAALVAAAAERTRTARRDMAALGELRGAGADVTSTAISAAAAGASIGQLSSALDFGGQGSVAIAPLPVASPEGVLPA